MMKKIDHFISPLLGDTHIFRGKKTVLGSLTKWLESSVYDRIIIISDTIVMNLYKENLEEFLPADKPYHWVLIKSGEVHKNMETLHLLGIQILDQAVTKRSLILNFGGGCVMNVGGLAASLLYRGLDFIHVPTTLMAQSDVVISNKQSINFHGSKNKWGIFSPAKAVFINYDFLITEPQRQIDAALIEYCKNALILGREEYQMCFTNLQALRKGQISLQIIVNHSLYQKQIIAQRDPSEKKSGQILEYGHTLGHALEYLSQGDILHGEAVYFGLIFAGMLAYHLKIMKKDSFHRQRNLLESFARIKYCYVKHKKEEILRQLGKDNKKISSDVQFIFLKEIGQPYVENNQLLTSVSHKDLEIVLEEFLNVVL